jgi:hypothetical protein
LGVVPVAAATEPTQITTPCSADDPRGTYCGDSHLLEEGGLSMPRDVTARPGGGELIADSGHFVLRSVTDGILATAVGTGALGVQPPAAATTTGEVSLGDPRGVAALSDGGTLIADAYLKAALRVTSDGVVTPLVAAPDVALPVDVAELPGSVALVLDQQLGQVLAVDGLGAVTPLVTGLHAPDQLAVDGTGAVPTLLITEQGGDGAPADVVRVDPATGLRTVVAGPGASGAAGQLLPVAPTGVAVAPSGEVVYADGQDVRAVSMSGDVRTVFTAVARIDGLDVTTSGVLLAAQAEIDRVVAVPLPPPADKPPAQGDAPPGSRGGPPPPGVGARPSPPPGGTPPCRRLGLFRGVKIQSYRRGVVQLNFAGTGRLTLYRVKPGGLHRIGTWLIRHARNVVRVRYGGRKPVTLRLQVSGLSGRRSSSQGNGCVQVRFR